MFELIVRTLKRVGVKLILKEFYVESYLNYYSIHFLDKYDNWCNLKVFYNETQFFVDDSIKLIGKGRDYIYTDSIINSIALLGSYDDFMNTDIKEPTKKDVDDYLEKSLTLLSDSLSNMETPSKISIKEVKIFTQPSLMVFIYFTFRSVRVEPIKFFLGEKINYESKFIDKDVVDKDVGDRDVIDKFINDIEEVLKNE